MTAWWVFLAVASAWALDHSAVEPTKEKSVLVRKSGAPSEPEFAGPWVGCDGKEDEPPTAYEIRRIFVLPESDRWVPAPRGQGRCEHVLVGPGEILGKLAVSRDPRSVEPPIRLVTTVVGTMIGRPSGLYRLVPMGENVEWLQVPCSQRGSTATTYSEVPNQHPQGHTFRAVEGGQVLYAGRVAPDIPPEAVDC